MTGPTRHNNQLHRSEDALGDPITAGYIPSADGASNWVWVDPATLISSTSVFYNVVDYGATGDGTTDDTSAITATFDAADATGGGVIYFPPTANFYKITTLITRTGTSKYHLLGGGARYGPARVHQATADTGAFKFAPSSGTAMRITAPIIENLVVSGAGGATTSRGIEFNNDGHVVDCLVYGFFDGLYLSTASFYSLIKNTTITDCDHAGIVASACNNLTIDTVRILGDPGGATAPVDDLTHGIIFVGGLMNRVVNTSIEYFIGCGIIVQGGGPITIQGNYFETQQSSSSNAHIILGDDTQTYDAWVVNNYFQGDGIAGFEAIILDNAVAFHILANRFGINSAIGISHLGGSSLGFCWGNTNTPTGTFTLPSDTITSPGGGAPTTADYLVGTANGSLSAEIVVGTTPGGELGGTWASPTVDATHSGSAHADFIAKAIVDAKGDLIAATAADTVARVAVGTDGQFLKADSGASAGVSWATPSGTGVGQILIADVHSTPLIFADLLQNEAQDDLIYADI